MRLIFALAALCLLAGCSGGGSSSPPSSAPIVLNMNASSWVFQYSPNMPGTPTQVGTGWLFNFPSVNGVHYLVQGGNGRIVGSGMSANVSITKTDGALFMEAQPCGDYNPMNAKFRFYFQRRGDDVSGQGVYEYYRWFTSEGYSLASGDGTFTVPFDPAKWVSVFGKTGDTNPSGFASAMADVQAIGITFGGCFAGHGVFVSEGQAIFQANEVKIY